MPSTRACTWQRPQAYQDRARSRSHPLTHRICRLYADALTDPADANAIPRNFTLQLQSRVWRRLKQVTRERLLAPPSSGRSGTSIVGGSDSDGAGGSGGGSDDADGEVAQLLQFCEIPSRWALTQALAACSSASPSKIETALALRAQLGVSNEACVALAQILAQPPARP